MQLRCPNKVHGVIVAPSTGRLEVSCRSAYCGYDSSSVVRHTFDLTTGEVVHTEIFKKPPQAVPEGIAR